MRTPLCQRLGIEVPIIHAPLGGAVGPTLAAAVSNAGGLGLLLPWRADLDTVRRQIRETRELTRRPFGVNLTDDLWVMSPFRFGATADAPQQSVVN